MLRPREADPQGLAGEAGPFALVARYPGVGKEAHLDLPLALPAARGAAPAARALAGVEGEPARRPPAQARLGRLGEDAPHVVPDLEVGDRAGARGLADRGLIDLEHAGDRLEAEDRLASRAESALAVAAGLVAGPVAGPAAGPRPRRRLPPRRGAARLRGSRAAPRGRGCSCRFPLTPVTQTRRPSGNRGLMPLRLCRRAFLTIEPRLAARRRRDAPGARSASAAGAGRASAR